MEFTIIPMKAGNRMIRLGLGQHEGVWFIRLDFWYAGFRLSGKNKKTSVNEEISRLTSQVIDILPEEITGKDNGCISWREIDNRDYLRAMLVIGYALCKLGKDANNPELTEKGFAFVWAFNTLCDTEPFSVMETLKEMKLQPKFRTWFRKLNLSRSIKEILIG